jgi:hypothetical protein
MNLRVTQEARTEWEQLAEAEGVTCSALAEAIGLVVIREGRPLSDALAEARRIMRDRQKRRED